MSANSVWLTPRASMALSISRAMIFLAASVRTRSRRPLSSSHDSKLEPMCLFIVRRVRLPVNPLECEASDREPSGRVALITKEVDTEHELGFHVKREFLAT